METADCCKANQPCEWSSLVAKRGDRETNYFFKTFLRGRAAPFLMAVLSGTLCRQQITIFFFVFISAAVTSDANVLCHAAAGISA